MVLRIIYYYKMRKNNNIIALHLTGRQVKVVIVVEAGPYTREITIDERSNWHMLHLPPLLHQSLLYVHLPIANDPLSPLFSSIVRPTIASLFVYSSFLFGFC